MVIEGEGQDGIDQVLCCRGTGLKSSASSPKSTKVDWKPERMRRFSNPAHFSGLRFVSAGFEPGATVARRSTEEVAGYF
ncbi:MAG TPA: hypothetical protein VKU87_05120, partial [Thermomicrobiaceae bacterium]|nr:hypothetical protein [Thermomicrobiaceae bacterium]